MFLILPLLYSSSGIVVVVGLGVPWVIDLEENVDLYSDFMQNGTVGQRVHLETCKISDNDKYISQSEVGRPKSRPSMCVFYIGVYSRSFVNCQIIGPKPYR